MEDWRHGRYSSDLPKNPSVQGEFRRIPKIYNGAGLVKAEPTIEGTARRWASSGWAWSGRGSRERRFSEDQTPVAIFLFDLVFLQQRPVLLHQFLVELERRLGVGRAGTPCRGCVFEYSSNSARSFLSSSGLVRSDRWPRRRWPWPRRSTLSRPCGPQLLATDDQWWLIGAGHLAGEADGGRRGDERHVADVRRSAARSTAPLGGRRASTLYRHSRLPGLQFFLEGLGERLSPLPSRRASRRARCSSG